MDFGFSQTQEELRNSFRNFLDKECPPELVKKLWNDPTGYSKAIWKKMAQMGWLGLIHPKKYEGGESDFLELFILFEEIGYSLLPSPLLTSAVLCGMIISNFGDDPLKETSLPEIISGRKIWTLALLNDWGEPDFNSPGLDASYDGEWGYFLNGVRLMVPYADSADEIIVCADLIGPMSGPTLLRLNRQNAGIACTRLEAIYGERKCVVEFKNVPVRPEDIIGEPGFGNVYLDKILPLVITLKCAEMVGGMRRLLNSTVSHAKKRRQFSRPLSAFQSVLHHCADMNTLYVTARLNACNAACRLNEELPCHKEVAIAKAWCSEAYKKCSWIAQQIYGGIGFTEECHIHLYYKHAKECELLFGDSRHHRGKIADAMGF